MHCTRDHALLQKSYTTATIPYRRKKNHGEATQYYIENSNPAIISREMFEAVRRKYESRKYTSGCCGNRLLSRMVYCGDCGHAFRRNGQSNGRVILMCSGRAAGKTDCEGIRITESAVFQCFTIMVLKLSDNRQEILGTLICQLDELQSRASCVSEKTAGLDKQIQ